MSETGFTFKGRGKFVRLETFAAKSGKEIITIIISVDGQYPQLVPVKCFGRMAETARSLRPGDLVEVTGRLGGREWNAKVFGDNTAESIEKVGGDQQELLGAPTPGDDDAPF